MPGKRARRHFSQLSEFERGLIIGMKTAGWSTRRVAGQVDRSECAVRNCWEQWTREGREAFEDDIRSDRRVSSRTDVKVKEIVRKDRRVRERIEYTPGSGRRPLFPEARLELCDVPCKLERVATKVTLATRHIGQLNTGSRPQWGPRLVLDRALIES
ncbi:uncharacterized protein TNCV_1441571 [Trichonephila clavipes]|uniref:Transposase n=1 Tax=Trichonephila clavipes TaxID=2585209 RepID=A0A8X6V6P5_TRICX|nr:uncharacterized protein TNCV_1441571 [Trichonephila clavipes]